MVQRYYKYVWKLFLLEIQTSTGIGQAPKQTVYFLAHVLSEPNLSGALIPSKLGIQTGFNNKMGSGLVNYRFFYNGRNLLGEMEGLRAECEEWY